MGDLDVRPFQIAIKSRYSKEEADVKTLEVCSLWETYLADPNWHPFKIITDEAGRSKEIIDDKDEKLAGLKNELGDDVYQAVVTAMMELNEYNPSGRISSTGGWRGVLQEDSLGRIKETWLIKEKGDRFWGCQKQNEELRKKITELEDHKDQVEEVLDEDESYDDKIEHENKAWIEMYLNLENKLEQSETQMKEMRRLKTLKRKKLKKALEQIYPTYIQSSNSDERNEKIEQHDYLLRKEIIMLFIYIDCCCKHQTVFPFFAAE
ncbi:hypothetical protein ACLB2K_031183 [Fragaria x ananassa]